MKNAAEKKSLTDQSHHRPDLLLSDIVLRIISKYILYYLKFRFRDKTTDTKGKHIFPFLSKTSLIWSIHRMQLHHQIAPYLFCASISGVLQRFTALYIFSITLQQTVAKPGEASWRFRPMAWCDLWCIFFISLLGPALDNGSIHPWEAPTIIPVAQVSSSLSLCATCCSCCTFVLFSYRKRKVISAPPPPVYSFVETH